MKTDGFGRKPDLDSYANEMATANQKWRKLLNDKRRIIQHAMSISGSMITPHRLLILVDLQSVYLALHRWLSENRVPIDDGVILGEFAHLQIERTSKEVANRLVSSQPRPTANLEHLFDSIEIDYTSGTPRVGKTVEVLQEGVYLDIATTFEMFYAPVPLKNIEWNLRLAARRGSAEAKEQLRKVRSGVVAKKGTFERNYKAYDDFVSYLKESAYHSRSHEGFFGYSVGDQGLRYFDEKEVDIRIAIRMMDALHNREADSICIISSDQDFMPLHARADDFGVPSFQADLAKFLENDRVGSKLKNMGQRFIQGGMDPGWPLRVLTTAMSSPAHGHFQVHRFSEQEWQALCRIHNELNEVKIALDVSPDGKIALKMYRPATSS